ncbi:hypothetical protein [Arthrobacter roseus]|uniref:phage tail tube protein n=1 Tax=Arthrobacter roseus TaxID=136274 RepID=UPI0019642B9A|nr:hypothetical protein [Arthrobacter roseus]MBM7847460.1 hypothetical protein [Arthrobacter roseus]
MAELPSTPADGNVLVKLIPAVADMDAPKLTELNAAGATDISCYLTSDGYTPGVDQAGVPDERLCSTQIFEQPGRVTNSLNLTYIDNTNAPNELTDNMAKTTLISDSTHVLLVRRGVPYEDALAAGQTVTLWPIKAGIQHELPPEANSVLKISQKQFVTGPVARSVKISATV